MPNRLRAFFIKRSRGLVTTRQGVAVGGLLSLSRGTG